ncbi:polyketide-8 synthase acyl carrier protein [Actinopolyspora erythraea]|uniref:Polyketide-8 synthase acyl carrier protein n=2 Tax=Actinopolyspora TaxID=1849 RepID=A0A099D8A3_9ACTN|nr:MULTISPECIES: acyl carrier protein [Actinopolyspora]ASU81252.1 polyketide-8 synthase acyl carrier protein [Actinopolyspora erythraea]KGI82383.1 polyketide-8 synthase acyl carrier protein [Actinopolyspora erythraea]SFT84132.1 acyl carrier protein [Actinopolyspora righensis]
MTTSVNERHARIKELVCEVLELDQGEVTDTSLFIEDHEADSLRAIEILASLEKEFGITIDQSELPRLVNLESVYTVVDREMG